MKALYTLTGIITGIVTFCVTISIFANMDVDSEKYDETDYSYYIESLSQNFEERVLESICLYEVEKEKQIETMNEENIITTEKNIATKVENVYIIQNGDNFWNICEKYYGDGNYCFALAEYNNLTINSTIIAGCKLIIPFDNDLEFVSLVEKYETDINIINEYPLNERVSPAMEITIPTGNDMKNYTGDVDTSNYQYIGDWKITGYDPKCAHCCNGNTHGIGAAGVEVIPGYSVATKDLPLNTTIYIKGYGYYVIEDRGCGEGVIDIACSSHDTCYPITNMDGVAVYIVN